MNSNSKELLAEQKKKYRTYQRNLPLIERLRQLEELQKQTYEIMRIREANGGKPISRGWRQWAEAQKEIASKK